MPAHTCTSPSRTCCSRAQPHAGTVTHWPHRVSAPRCTAGHRHVQPRLCAHRSAHAPGFTHAAVVCMSVRMYSRTPMNPQMPTSIWTRQNAHVYMHTEPHVSAPLHTSAHTLVAHVHRVTSAHHISHTHRHTRRHSAPCTHLHVH